MKSLRKILLLLCILAGTLSCASRQEASLPDCVIPAFLAPGDTIALISPAYHTPMENVEGAAEILRSWGFVPVVGPNVGKTFRGAYAGTDEERMADLRWALEEPSVKAILCNRGGYGTLHMVGRFPLELFAAHPKWLIGFSDITTLLAMENCAGVMAVHGTMCGLMNASGGEGVTNTLLRDLLLGTVLSYDIPAHPDNCPGVAEGVLVGGNLSTLVPLPGTEADPTVGRDCILLLEEVEEDLQHIDRMICMLELSGLLDRCKGVVLGEFTDCKANQDYASAEEMIVSRLKGRGIPVCCGFPAGHGDVNFPLVMGAPVRLEVTSEESVLLFFPGD